MVSPDISSRCSAGGQKISPAVDVEGKYLDLAKTGVSLARGGIYRGKAGGRSIVFKIDAYARSGPGPIIGRLISF